jgi:hypothetical protein
MKQKIFKSLHLGKETISNLEMKSLKGGTGGMVSCDETTPRYGCWTNHDCSWNPSCWGHDEPD